jgi:antirestriction protein ArdC
MSQVYDLITNKILEQLEKGVIPWQMPWNSQMPKNLITKKPYRGINILLLSFTDYKSPYWLTYKQAKDLKGVVKAGAKGTPIVYWNIARVLPKDTGDEAERLIPFLKYHTVFNVEQCEKIPVPKDDLIEFKPIDECEKVINNMPKRPFINEGRDRACYIPSKDVVEMPDRAVFKSEEGFYSTLFHELVHSTGHTSRLNRNSINEPHAFGSETYSKEELIAEIGGSFVCGMTGISNQTLECNASYISNWLQRLRNDKKLIITASSHAQRACDFILNRKQGGNISK